MLITMYNDHQNTCMSRMSQDFEDFLRAFMSDHEEEQDKISHHYTFLKYCYNPTSLLDFERVQTIFI